MSLSRARHRRTGGGGDHWPGFVDALSSLLLVIIFLLSVFMLAQFFLGQALSGRDEALEKLNEQVSELGDLLALERQTNSDLRANISQLSASLKSSNMSREEMAGRIDDLEARLSSARNSTSQRAGELSTIKKKYAESQEALSEKNKAVLAAQKQVGLLNSQLAALRQQLGELQAALDASERRDKEQKATIVNLGKRLNAALASKVQELAQYRSEFFGRLRKVLGNRSDIKIQGDRFIFESEVLFASGSDQLGPEGKKQMAKIATTLIELAKKIPPKINWILQVDGHTDILPITTDRFPSNWELSTARAISVVRFLQSQGIPPDRLAATGFGPYQPIDPHNTPEAYKRNRRIELKLTER